MIHAVWLMLAVAGGAWAQTLTPAAEAFIEEHFMAAKQAEARGDFAAAAAGYEKIVAQYPKAVPEIYQNLGLAHYLQKDCDKAVSAFEKGIALKPGMVGARLFLGVCHVSRERAQQALPHLQFAHRAQPTAESAAHLGVALHALRKYTEAAKLFREALPGSDRKDQLIYLLGNSYLKASERTADAVTSRYPDSKYEYYIVAKVADGQQWNQIAAKEYLEAVKRDPMNASLVFPFARWLAVLGLEEPSKLAFDRYRALMPRDVAAKLNSSEIVRKEMADVGITVDYSAELRALPGVADGKAPPLAMFTSEVNEEVKRRAADPRWKKAIDAFSGSDWKAAQAALRAMRSAPGDWLPAYLLASVELWLEDAAAAEKTAAALDSLAASRPWISILQWDIHRQLSFQYLQQLLEEHPRSAWAHLVKGRTLDMQGKREALDEYRAALDADPSLPEVRIAIADFHLANSNFQEAAAECRKELELNPASVTAKLRLGRIHVELREADKGVPLLQEALKIDPGDANAHFDLGRGLEIREDFAGALASYQRALQLDPSMNRLHYVLARLYRRMGKPELATQEYKKFQQKEAGARQQYQERLRRLRETGTPVEKP